MKLKEYIKAKGMTTRQCSIKCGVPYSTLNDLLNGKTDVEKVQFGCILKIAELFGISVYDIYAMCKQYVPKIQGGRIIIKNKAYYLLPDEMPEPKERLLHRVDNDIRPFIKELAEWTLEDMKDEERFDSWQIHTT